MKKCIILLSCLAMLLLCGCSKEKTNVSEMNGAKNWASLVEDYPFLSAFPEFRGDIENAQYHEFGSLKSVVFFDYNCEESVATTYYASLADSGFTKSEGGDIYRKKTDDTVYIFTGGYSAGNFALSFSADKN